MKNIQFAVLLMIMSITIYGNALEEATFEGQLRVGYQNHDTQGTNENEVAIGLKLHYESATYYGLQVGTTLYTTQGNGDAGFEGVPFFDKNNENYTTIAEAYLKGTFSNTQLIIGRQSFETPFADSDDIGMVPNTFEAITLVNTDIQDTTLFFSHVQKWSGVDSDAPSEFTEVNGHKGMQIFGLTYEGLNNITLAGWFYNLQDEVQITYLEANYEKETPDYTYGATLQYASQNYEVGENAYVYGAAASFGVQKIGLNTTIAYNKTDGRAAENFFGGGPFVTNAEHNTLKEAGADGNTILYTLEWDASVVGVEDLNFVLNIDGHHGARQHAHEYDFAVEYAYSETIQFSAIYSNVDDNDDSFKNLRVFANYNF